VSHPVATPSQQPPLACCLLPRVVGARHTRREEASDDCCRRHRPARVPQEPPARGPAPRRDEGLLPHLEPIALTFKQVLYERDAPIPHLYFPAGGVVSLLITMDDGAAIEVATIGNEGLVGLAAVLGVEVSTERAIVQIAGDALRMEADVVARAIRSGSPTHDLLLRYAQALMMSLAQTAACNRLHPMEERCARWLLQTHDRVRSDAFPLTHAFLAQMLGVRRATVTVAAGMLQQAGLIRYSRGVVTIVDRPGLEAASCACYRLIQARFDRLLG